MAGLYVHLPFCPYICPYCDFAKWPLRRSQAEAYLEALRTEIAATPPRPIETIFLGGGTPNTYPAAALARLLADVRARFPVAPDAEVTLEANPDPALCGAFAELRAAGVNRLSIGAQSFDPAELLTLGRRHGPDDVREAVRRGRAAGFTNVSLDLIFAVPGQTEASWARSLDAAIATGADHVSTYGLTIEEPTPYAIWYDRDPAAFPDDSTEAELYALAIARLGAAGFEQYEISNFAKPGFRSAHNANYWANGEYVGVGVGAASYLDGRRSVHTRNLEEYVAAARAGGPIPGESERLTGPARWGEATMLALRTREGVDVEAFRLRYGFDFLSYYAAAIEELSSAGVLDVAPTHVRLTERGRFVANDVARAFIA